MIKHYLLCFQIVCLFSLIGCDRGSEPVDITDSVVTFDPKNTFEVPEIVEDDIARLNLRRTSQWYWDTPEGWELFDPTQFRKVNLKFGENKEGQCYLGQFDSGTLIGNINRWRSEMGAEDLSAEEISALPKITLGGGQATMLTVDGTFTSRGGNPQEGYRLVAAIISRPGLTITVKMTGPKELLVANEAKFKSFCSSLEYK